MVAIEEQDDYYSDSDSDDEDVDRYVFLARQPAPPAGRHAEDDDRDASSASDDDDGDGTAGEEESEGGVRKTTKKRPLGREILADGDAPPPTKKARLELIIASPLAAQTPPSGSESSSSPRTGESGSEGSHEKAHERRAPKEKGEAKNATKKKRAACGKRSRSSGGEADGDRDDVAAAAAAKTAGASSGATATSGRFPCSLCDRCFDSHQALGGHVLGHRKRTKIAIAAGAILDVVDVAGEESAAVEVTEEAAKSIVQADKKDLVAARRGKANGDGSSSDEGNTVDDAAEHGNEDVDRARHKRQRKVHGKGNGGGVRDPVFAGSHDDANGDDAFGVSGHGFKDGNSRSDDGKIDIGKASPNRKVVGAGTCHEGANGNGNVCRTRYKCKVCGTECLTGRALGGHMRKHRKRALVGGGGGGEDRSPSPASDDDCQIPLAQLFGAD